ncbi:hypothetical protein GCM10023197_23210 [Gordonia humi]
MRDGSCAVAGTGGVDGSAKAVPAPAHVATATESAATPRTTDTRIINPISLSRNNCHSSLALSEVFGNLDQSELRDKTPRACRPNAGSPCRTE